MGSCESSTRRAMACGCRRSWMSGATVEPVDETFPDWRETIPTRNHSRSAVGFEPVERLELDHAARVQEGTVQRLLHFHSAQLPTRLNHRGFSRDSRGFLRSFLRGPARTRSAKLCHPEWPLGPPAARSRPLDQHPEPQVAASTAAGGTTRHSSQHTALSSTCDTSLHALSITSLSVPGAWVGLLWGGHTEPTAGRLPPCEFLRARTFSASTMARSRSSWTSVCRWSA